MFFASFESMVLDESKHWLQRSLTSAQDSLLLLVSCSFLAMQSSSFFRHPENTFTFPVMQNLLFLFSQCKVLHYFSRHAELTVNFPAMQNLLLLFPPSRKPHRQASLCHVVVI